MNVAIVGAAGACGRQLAVQLLDRRILPVSSRLQLVGNRSGHSKDELWGLRADLEDAFDDAPAIELIVDPPLVDADIVVMLAGVTIPTDPNAAVDRAALGRANYRIFAEYADALAAKSGQQPAVIVQSNPVELGVQVFAERLGRHRVIGAGGWSDTLRLRAELAAELGVSRSQVHAWMFGQHGDNLVPIWSLVRSRAGREAVAAMLERVRLGRTLADLPGEVRTNKAQMLELVRSGHVLAAYEFVKSLPPDLRAAVKPFFTHFTAGHTTEVVTAHAVADIVAALVARRQQVFPLQVALEGEWLDVHGVVGAPVVLSLDGWEHVYPLKLRSDEIAAIENAASAVAAANDAVLQSMGER